MGLTNIHLEKRKKNKMKKDFDLKNVELTLDKFSLTEGWSDATQRILLIAFVEELIEKGQIDEKALYNYLEERTHDEEE
jgi:hypothetical protein